MKYTVARMTQRGLHEAATCDHRVVAETDLAAEVKHLLAGGQREEAAERFGAIIDRQQRRAARIAYHYLRDPAEVDEVVQDAFLKAFLHLPSFREDLFFELWFTRILVNACLDRLKAKARRTRWLVPSDARERLAAALGRSGVEAEQGHDPVADELVDPSAGFLHHLTGDGEIAVEHEHHVIGQLALREACKGAQIGEQDRHLLLPALKMRRAAKTVAGGGARRQ